MRLPCLVVKKRDRDILHKVLLFHYSTGMPLKEGDTALVFGLITILLCTRMIEMLASMNGLSSFMEAERVDKLT